MGLHAKVYLAEDGGEIHLYVGSANATSAALMAGRNVEVLAELTGRRYRVGGVYALLEEEGIGGYLTPWSRESPALDDETDAERLAENSLERARHALGGRVDQRRLHVRSRALASPTTGGEPDPARRCRLDTGVADYGERRTRPPKPSVWARARWLISARSSPRR